MPLGFLRRGTVLTANVLSLILGATVAGLSFILTIYLQQILGYSASEAGAGFLPGAIIFFVVGAWGASRPVNRYGIRRALAASAALMATGSSLLVGISRQGDYLGILPGMIRCSLAPSIVL